MHSWMNDFLIQGRRNPGLLKKLNPASKKHLKKVWRERSISRNQAVPWGCVRTSDWWWIRAPGKYPSCLIPGSAAGNEPCSHKLVRAVAGRCIPFTISSSMRPLMQIEQDVTATSGTEWDTETDKNKSLSWRWPDSNERLSSRKRLQRGILLL